MTRNKTSIRRLTSVPALEVVVGVEQKSQPGSKSHDRTASALLLPLSVVGSQGERLGRVNPNIKVCDSWQGCRLPANSTT